MQTLKPNHLYQWKAHFPYEGCFWQWHFASIGPKGEFMPISCKSKYPTDTAAQLEAALNDTASDAMNDDFSVFNLENPKEIEELLSSNQDGNAVALMRWINSNTLFDAALTCTQCKKKTDEVDTTGERGCGGLAVEAYGIVCEGCISSYSCSYCGGYDPETPRDDDNYCPDCAIISRSFDIDGIKRALSRGLVFGDAWQISQLKKAARLASEIESLTTNNEA